MNARLWILVATVMCVSLHEGTIASAQSIESDVSIDEKVQQLIERLDSSRFSDRARATSELQRMGAAAIEPLEKVVLNGSSEAAIRALSILKQNFKSDSGQLSDPARQALERIARAEDHPNAQLADQILNPPPPMPKTPAPRRRPPALPMNRRIQVAIKSVNGQREIKITEDGRKFKFNDVEGGIAVERPDGKGGVKKERYKDKDEMKEKDPEAYSIYQKYVGKNRIQFKFGQPFGPGIPQFAPQPGIELRERRAIPELRRPPAPRGAPAPREAPKPKLDNTIEV